MNFKLILFGSFLLSFLSHQLLGMEAIIPRANTQVNKLLVTLGELKSNAEEFNVNSENQKKFFKDLEALLEQISSDSEKGCYTTFADLRSNSANFEVLLMNLVPYRDMGWKTMCTVLNKLVEIAKDELTSVTIKSKINNLQEQLSYQ